MIESLLTLVVATRDTDTKLSAKSIDLVNEDDALGVFLSIGEQIRNTGRTNTLKISTNSDPEMEKEGDPPST